MYSKVFKGAALAPAATILPQLGAGIYGTVVAGIGIAMIVLIAGSTVVAKLHCK